MGAGIEEGRMSMIDVERWAVLDDGEIIGFTDEPIFPDECRKVRIIEIDPDNPMEVVDAKELQRLRRYASVSLWAAGGVEAYKRMRRFERLAVAQWRVANEHDHGTAEGMRDAIHERCDALDDCIAHNDVPGFGDDVSGMALSVKEHWPKGDVPGFGGG